MTTSSRTDILLELSAKPPPDQQQYSVMMLQSPFFKLFPADRAKMARPQSKRDIRPLDYNRKMIPALCEWLDDNGCFHYFDGRIIFIKHDVDGLSMGDLLVSGAPINVYQRERVAFLLNALLHRCIESRRKENTAMKWAIGLGIAAGLVATMLFSMIAAQHIDQPEPIRLWANQATITLVTVFGGSKFCSVGPSARLSQTFPAFADLADQAAELNFCPFRGAIHVPSA